MQYAKPKVYWLMLIGVIFSILNTTTSYAAVTCPPGMIADNFAQTDYSTLAPNTSPPTPASNVNITGTASESYLVASNSLSAATGSVSGSSNTYSGTSELKLIPNFEFFQDFTSKTATRIVTYNFTNKFDTQPQLLNNFQLSVFDIDANFFERLNNINYFQFKDAVKAEGLDANNNWVVPDIIYKPSGMTTTSNFTYQTVNTRGTMCTNTSTDSNCKITYKFSVPIKAVRLTYGNDSFSSGIDYQTNSSTSGNNRLIGNPGFQKMFIAVEGYCYTPQPRLSLTKVLADNRIANTDQFTVQIKNGTTVVNSTTNSTTTGNTNVVTTGTGTTGTYKIDPTKTYVLTEAASGTTDLSKYQATYECKKKSDGTTITTLDPNNVKMTYGDDWVCTVSNAQKKYTFSGIIFNDNGGLTLTERQLTGTNTQYFNGVYDPTAGETGIYQTGLQVQLAKNCNTTSPTPIKTVPVNTDGTYSITATQTDMAGATNVCLIEQEPGGNLTTYPVDTTNNQLNINYVATTYNYPNLNFGEVSQNNAGLVLVKEQATNDCNITNTAMLGLTYNAVTQSGIDARKCVAYKITAYNRTNLTNPLTNVRITDALPKKGVNGSTVNSLLDNPLDTTSTNFKVDTANSVAIGANGTVVSDVQSLAKGASRSLYFNTKYDSSLP